MPTLDSADKAIAHAIFCGNLSLQPPVGADGKNLRLGEFCGGAPLSAIGSAMTHAVALVVGWRIPAQICKAIIRRIAVVVARLHSLRARPNKREQNKAVNFEEAIFVVSPQKQVKASIALIRSWFLEYASFHGANRPAIRNLVNALVPDNRLPLLSHDIDQNGDTGILA